jgi:hypothetical protein
VLRRHQVARVARVARQVSAGDKAQCHEAQHGDGAMDGGCFLIKTWENLWKSDDNLKKMWNIYEKSDEHRIKTK